MGSRPAANPRTEIMKMKMYAILDKAKPHSENIKGLSLEEVIYTTLIQPYDSCGISELIITSRA
jgi:hypothetical protein